MKSSIIALIKYFFGLLTYFIPKEQGYYAFMPTHDNKKISGNIKELLSYIDSNHNHKIKTRVISLNKQIIKSATTQGFGVKKTKIGFYWAILRAEHIIIDASTKTFRFGHFSLIQLWHGTGFKKIGVINDTAAGKTLKAFKREYQNYVLVIAGSKSDKERKMNAFNAQNVVVTGLPRNDYFYKPDNSLNQIKEKYGVKSFKQIFIYAPTFRKSNSLKISPDFWVKLNKILKNKNQLLVIKKHPWEKFLKIPNKCSNIIDFSNEITHLEEFLLVCDLLITDYSSLSTDFALLNKPVLIFAPDFKEYQKLSRGFYYDLKETLPKPFIQQEDELLKKIEDLSWLKEEEYKVTYNSFRNRFHQYFDGNSSKRVMQAVLKLKS